MSKELVIGSNRQETKVAILEEDQLVEIYFERANEYSLAGSIHKGRVTRVLPGMQSAFVDLGLERDTFLYVSDFFEENPDIDTVDEKPVRPSGRENERRDPERRDNDRRENEPPRENPRRERFQARPAAETVPVTVPEALPGEAGETVQEAAVEPDDDIEAAVSEPSTAPVVTATAPLADETRPQNRPPEGDRNGRGDRRGRRSRRRRTRGHGFPDSKYAQQGAGPVPASEPVTSEQEFAGTPETFETESRDIIVLPGESLAKYRPRGGVIEDAPEPPLAEPLEPVEEVPEPASIREEAESLELADKVFAHAPETPFEEEEKLEAVREETVSYTSRPSPFIVSGREALDIEESAIEPDEKSGGVPVLGPPWAAYEDREPAPADIAIDEPLASEEPESEEPESEEPEFEENDLEATVAVAESLATPASNETPSQTAVVRDPGDRYPHRVSRRMRRRRGGSNRFQGGSPEAPAETLAASAPALTVAPEIVEPMLVAPAPYRPPDRPSERSNERFAEREDRPLPSISELLKPGQEIIVQIAKEPLGQKGARITSHIALPGRYVVFMPSVTHLGVSRKIASDEERQRLKRILQAHRAGTTGGFIVRTAGEGVPEPEIAADMDFLYKSWLDIRQKAEKRPAPALLHYDLGIVQRILRDQVTEEFKAIWVDSEELYENILSFIQRFQPALVSRVKMYTRQAPIFDAFGITPELEKALRPKVWLKSGGYIVINQTEALVAIDINTGKYVGKSNRLEDTIVKTNLEAVKEIVRQIRLRDLGGIIVVDFIDMDERKNRQKVMQALEEAMSTDRAPSKILQFNDFGLVAITRKRVKQSLERTLCSPCPYCEGAGHVKSVQTVIGEILIEAQKIARAIESKDVLLRVHPEVAKILKANDNKYLEELEEMLGRPVLVKGDPALHIEKFDLG